MPIVHRLLLPVLVVLHVGCTGQVPALQDGDIVFQCTDGPQCEAIAQATRSPYTHCGIVFLQDGAPFVWEAVGPVRKLPYADWVRHGLGGHVVVSASAIPRCSPLRASPP